jgi:hypothetical protein
MEIARCCFARSDLAPFPPRALDGDTGIGRVAQCRPQPASQMKLSQSTIVGLRGGHLNRSSVAQTDVAV